MAKRGRPGKTCAYCGSADGHEGEHVFPASWYPDTTPADVQRLTVPSCTPCNKRWERVERELATDLLLVVSPNVPEVAGVHERLSRAWQPTSDQRVEERRHRIGRAIKIFNSMVWAQPVPGGPQTTVRTRAGLIVRASPARRIENRPLRDIAEKFIRGLHFSETGQVLGSLGVTAILVERDEKIMRLGEENFAAIVSALEQNPINTLGPGFWYRRYRGDPVSAWAFRIWGQVNILAFANTATSN
jgi:hypothetical protein